MTDGFATVVSVLMIAVVGLVDAIRKMNQDDM